MVGAIGIPGSKFYGGCDEIGGGGGGSSSPGRFNFVGDPNGLGFENRYFDIGGRTYEAREPDPISPGFTGVVALKIAMTGSFPDADIVTYGTVEAMQRAQKDIAFYTLPLYKLEEGTIVCDFRLGPPAVAWEFTDTDD